MKTKTKWSGKPLSIYQLAGFVYLVTNTVTGMMYVGRKYFWRSLRKKLPNSTRRTKVILESDWEYYKTSSKKVLSDIKLLGEDKFRFEILSCWKTRSEVNEEEVREQFSRNVLKEKNSQGDYLYYNESILSKFYRPKPEGTPEYVEKCENIQKGILAYTRSESYVHPLKGKAHPNRGKRLPQTKAKTSVVGRLRWTNGKRNLLLHKDVSPPDGYVRGVTTKPKGRSKVEIDYLKNPKLCEICGSSVRYTRRANRFCSMSCSNMGKSKQTWDRGTNPAQVHSYRTPAGIFLSSVEAGKALKCSDVTVRNRCREGVGGYSLLPKHVGIQELSGDEG